MKLTLFLAIIITRGGFGGFLRYRINKIQSSIAKRFEDELSLTNQQEIFNWLIGFARLIFLLLLLLLIQIIY